MRQSPHSKLKHFLFLLIGLVSSGLVAQPLEITNAPPITPENLISNVFLGEGVEVVSISYEGIDNAVGFFKNGDDEVGINRGIVMTTGTAVTAGLNIGVNSPGSAFASVGNNSTVDDDDLDDIAGGAPVNNVARYTISFIPISDTLRFRYAFGSEEYPEYACSEYNDIFGFFISGPGINGPYENNAENIARIPGTDLPVTINNVNSGMVGINGTLANCTPPDGTLAFSEFYNNNDNSSMMPVYDGLTDVFTAEAIVQPCSTYTIKLVIADVTDGAFDSGVFLEAKSFGTGSLDVQTTTVSLDGSVAEGCAEGLLTFSLPLPVESDFPIDYNILGTAENGVDYELIPPDLFIPAGDSILVIPIRAIEDGLEEGDETLLIDVQKDVCNRDTVSIIIRDNPLVPPDLRPDTMICQGESLSLDGTLDVPLPEPPAFSNTNDLLVAPVNVPVVSNVEVSGVIPDVLGPGVIKSICIDSLSHRWIDDIDIYLISPGGQFLELTTDNGGSGGNIFGYDYYLNTCFNEEAETAINSPGPFAPPEAVPFTGNWQPEGVWEDLWGGPTNGTWQLQLIDDTQGADDGMLHSWTICFNPVYEIKYSWTPAAGLSCTDCPNPVATPDVTTTYHMEATDSYGCSVYDSVTIEVMPAPDLQNLICGTVTGNSIAIAWDETPGALDYEVRVDGGTWMSTGGLLNYEQTGLTFAQTVTFEVRSIADCPGLPATIECMTPDCIPPSASTTTTLVSCFGGQDGSVMIEAQGGVPPYQFSLEGQTSPNGQFDGLAAGNYVAQVIDAADCPLNVQFVIDEPEGLDISQFVLTPISCNGEQDGEVMVTVNGGNGPFDYQWSTGDNTPTVANVGAGIHYVTITDGNNCMQIDSVELTEPDALELSLVPSDVTCAGANDGFAVAVPQGGVGPYTFLWDANASAQTTDTAFALAGGTYSVMVRDANNCEIELSVSIEENEPLILSLTTEDASCATSADGTGSVIPDGGSGDYTYQWLDTAGNTLGDEASIGTLPSGAYQLVLSDSDGCSVIEDFTIDAPEALDYTLETQAPLCAEGGDGTALVTPDGGTPGYTYQWSDMGNPVPQRTDLSAGNYTLTITDAQDCGIEIPVAVPETTPIELAFEVINISCFAGADASVTVSPTGGAGGYTYLWDNGQSNQTAANLEEGVINVTVTDANNCEVTGSALVESPEPIELSIQGVDPACEGENSGVATVITTGGTGPYAFEWNNGQTQEQAAGLTAGTYEVTVTDGNDCEAVISTVLQDPPALVAVLSSTEESCNGLPDGTATVEVSGGTMPYEYAWSDAETQAVPTAQGLAAGLYEVTVTDANGCELVESIEVTFSEQVIVSITGTNVSCNSGNDGTIEVTASGGTGTYTYNWSPSLPNTPTPSNLTAGTYTVSVTDANDCTTVESIEITEPTAISLVTETQPVVCADGADGAIDLSVSGGTGPYIYRWNNNSNEEDLTGLAPGTYSVVVTDENGCQASLQVDIQEPESLEATFTVKEVDCYGDSDGAIATTIRGGVPPYVYNWSNGADVPSLETLSAGEYRLNLTDANGCTLQTMVEVPQPDGPLDADIGTEDISCFDGRDGLISIDATGGTPGYTYSLDGINYSGNYNRIGLREGSYRVYIRDFKGCQFVSDEVTINEPDPIEVDLGPDITMKYGETVDLQAAVSGANGMVFYEWSPQDSTKLSCFDCPNPRISVDGQTSFKLTVMDENGCSAEDIINIFVSKERGVMVPTGFSPNGDNMNDRLLVHGRKLTRVVSFRVFDRWGELLYEDGGFDINDPAFGWDGTFRGEPAGTGVYVWTVTVEYEDGATESLSGSTTLIR